MRETHCALFIINGNAVQGHLSEKNLTRNLLHGIFYAQNSCNLWYNIQLTIMVELLFILTLQLKAGNLCKSTCVHGKHTGYCT